MTIDELLTAVYPELDGLEYPEKRDQFIRKELPQVLQISWQAVYKWDKKYFGVIPPARAIELVRHYNIDPQTLIK